MPKRETLEFNQLQTQPTPAFPNRVYDLIYADPPWTYNLRNTDKTHRGRTPYPCMNNEEILALPISTLLAPNSYLWLWTTKDHLHFALDCGRHWGLTLKQQFIWVKTTADGSSLKMGLGHWGRNCSENLLLFVRGKPLTLIKRGATNIPNVIFAPRLAHSAKPNCVREAIDRYFPDCSKLEMFARNRSPGWDVWGKEAA